MKVYIGADHRGFLLKEQLKEYIVLLGHEVIDCGATTQDPRDDFVDYAKQVGEQVGQDPKSRGIVICGSGAGMCIVTNKFSGVRCVLATTEGLVKAARRDNDVNILALGADFVDSTQAQVLITAFLETPFASEERFIRRLNKIKELETHA